MDVVGLIDSAADGYHSNGSARECTPDFQDNHYEELSDNEMSEEILTLIIRSVQKQERLNSAKKKKRKRSTFARSDVNGSEADNEMKAYSRCSISYFHKVLVKVRSCPRYVELVISMGFGEILQLDDCCVPRSFVQWVANNVCTDGEVIKIGSRSIELTPQSVSDSLGTPSGELSVDSDEELGKAAFLAIFGLIEVPSISFFGKQILGTEALSDGIFCRCFMAVALGTFFCPNSNTKISTKYMGALVVVDKIKDRNWSKYIHDWLLFYIKKYLAERFNANSLNRTLGGCIYHLAVRCLDFVDFTPIQIPATLPRVRVWKGNLIKIFSDMFMGTNGKYGAYPVMDISKTCYSTDNTISDEDISSDAFLKESIDAAIGHLVDSRLKEVISSAFISSMKDEEREFCLKVQELVVQVVNAIMSNCSGSQETLKLTSSEEDSRKTTIESGSTEKLPTSEEYSEDDFDADALVQRKRARTEVNSFLENSSHIEIARTIEDLCQNANPATNLDSSGNKKLVFDPVQSASLAHMIPVNGSSEKAITCDDVSSKQVNIPSIVSEEKEVKSTLLDLNQFCVEAENEGFYGFNGENYEQENLDSVLVKDQHEASGECSQSVMKITDRGDYLEIARYKYFFYDKDIPSFRLVENEDDLGNFIEEPELHRPIGMDHVTYNKLIELAISNAKKMITSSSDHNVICTPSATKQDKSTELPIDKTEVLEGDTSIQCAQKEPSVTGLSNSPRLPFAVRDNFVDLVSPEEQIPSIEGMHEMCSQDQETPRSLIIGRRLFEEKDDAYGSSSISKRPVREMLSKISNESSPELQILGERSFKDSCNIMNLEAEEMYNTRLSLAGSSSSYGKENLLPQRIPQRSKYVCSPFDVNPTPMVAVTDFQKKIWDAVTTLCDIEPECLEWAINIDNIRVKMIQLGSSMKENGWVEAWLMNVFCRKLFRDNHPRKTNKHFFFNTTSDYFLEKWKNEETMVAWKRRAIESFTLSNKARALHLSDGLYFPTVAYNHWFVFMVDIKYRNWIFLDSFYSQGSSYHKKLDTLLIKNFIATWNEVGLKKMNFESFGTAYPNVPKQKTGNDCGIFSMKFLQLFTPRNPAQCSFSHLDIPAFRIQYAHDILMSDHNTEENAKFMAAGFSA